MKANTEISLRSVPHYSKVQSEALNARWVYGTWSALAHKNDTYWWGVLRLWQQGLRNNRLLGLTPCNLTGMYGRFSHSKMLPPSGYGTIVTRWRALRSEGRCSVPDRGAGFSFLQSIQIVAMPNGIKGALSPSVKQPDVQSWPHAFSGAQVKRAWRYIATSLYAFMAHVQSSWRKCWKF